MTAELQRLRAGALAGARTLRIAASLADFPPEIFDLADTLEVLDLSGNRLSALPADLHRLHRLKVFFASDNDFTELPAALGACPRLEMVGFKANRIAHVPAAALPPRLRWLILTDNAIAELPEALGDRPRLQKLMLAGNRLRALPDRLRQCERLELLRIAANRLDALPQWLAAMPRLAWLAQGGNAFNETVEARARDSEQAQAIDWHALRCGERLGEGASGHIHAAVLHGSSGPHDVAVKLFKGAVTSDGWPMTEMAASLAAGRHARTISVLGRLAGHPDGQQGLVMERVGPDWRPLAGPPSFETCTRDVYAPGLRLPAATALRIAADVASALAHLHGRGIVHGDLYAHNVLWRPHAPPGEASALLGDFGAAAFAPAGALGDALRRMDVRAYGILLGELAERCEQGAGGRFIDQATALAQACMQARITDRPDGQALAARTQAWAEPALATG
ncbi:leucine-rich repeat-containing protein kinase family protein [Acidovorax sp. FG27]|uniref:leucine-rich repeat-containing protein kinase family protein n=1 Tax=Acidovorax sp. FG27 TaxID=3133652 RepID=UPI0030E987B0